MRKPVYAICEQQRPRHEKMSYANNKGADQPAHPRSLISAFVVRCLDSIIPLVSISKILSLYLASVAAQAGLCLTWSQIPKTGFVVTWLISSFSVSVNLTQVLKGGNLCKIQLYVEVVSNLLLKLL